MAEPIIERVDEFALSKKDRPKAEFEKVGIVGCGSTGQKLAVIIAKRGIDVVFIELSQEKIDEAFQEIKELLDYELNHWGITEGEMKAVMGRINGTLEMSELRSCDMVIESTLSKTRESAIESRQKLFKQIEKNVSPSTIIATNSTTIAITELASVLDNRNRCISMHISLTSPHAKLVEVVKSLYTTDDVCRNVQKFATLIGKNFINVAESPGLITVRLFAPMINEACHILMESVADMEIIDMAAKKSMNLPLGPFEMADRIGIDRVIRWLENMYEEFGDHHYKPSPILKRLYRAKRTGQKVNHGFYIYKETGEKIKPAFSKF